jgi:SET domain-containing protein
LDSANTEDYFIYPDLDESFAVRGSAMFLLASFLNHSCEPNVTMFPGDDHKVVFMALRPIRPGDELVFSYIGHKTLMSRETRRKLIKEKFGFDCECFKCRAEVLHSKVLS